jgi:serine/threonine protein phosphatase PrpC
MRPLLSYQGNAGDSRSVLGIKGRAKPMSFDHKPQNDSKDSHLIPFGRAYLTHKKAKRQEFVLLEALSISEEWMETLLSPEQSVTLNSRKARIYHPNHRSSLHIQMYLSTISQKMMSSWLLLAMVSALNQPLTRG